MTGHTAKAGLSQGWGIAGLLMNFIKAVLLVIVAQHTISDRIGIQIIDFFQFVFLNTTPKIVEANSSGEFDVSFYLTSLSGEPTPFNLCLDETSLSLAFSQASGPTSSGSDDDASAQPCVCSESPSKCIPNLKAANDLGSYQVKLKTEQNEVQSRFWIEFPSRQINGAVASTTKDCCTFAVSYKPPVNREYEMHVVRGQWDLLPEALRREGISFTLRRRGSGGELLQSGDLRGRLISKSSWRDREVFDGNLASPEVGEFTLTVFVLPNRPPASVFDLNEVRFLYPKHVLHFPDSQVLDREMKDFFFILSEKIVDPDGTNPPGTLAGARPKPELQHYNLKIVENSFERTVEGTVSRYVNGRFIPQNGLDPGGNAFGCPYTLLGRNSPLTGGQIFLSSREFPPPAAKKERPNNYDSFLVKATDSEGNSAEIKVVIVT